MLTSSIIFSTLKPAVIPPNLPNKDIGIFSHILDPTPKLNSTYKKSSTNPSCLAVSPTHIFAVQSDKAIVQVYDREKGTREADVPFGEKIASCYFVGIKDGTAESGIGVLVLGMEGGRLILWEICTGRQISTPPAHLEAVTCLAIDSTRNFLLSGSKDHNVHVWSLPDLLSFATDTRTSYKTFSDHRGAISSLAIGHSQLSNDFVLSASEDKTILLWNYRTATRLATFLTPTIPKCLALDPADRAFYIGFEDHVQFVDLHAITFDHPNEATELGNKGKWEKDQPLLCLTVSRDGVYIFTGHQDGKILKRTTPRGQPSELYNAHLPITNITVPPLTGFIKEQHPTSKPIIIKPKLDMVSKRDDSLIPNHYELNATFESPIPSYEDTQDNLFSNFDALLEHPSFPDPLLYASLTTTGKTKAIDENALEELEILKRENRVAVTHIDHLTAELKKCQDVEIARQQRKKLKRLRRCQALEMVTRNGAGGIVDGKGDMQLDVQEPSSDTDE